jgi:predicted acetyltransferase
LTTELVRPGPRYRDSFFEASREFGPDEDTLVYEREHAVRDFDGFVKAVEGWSRGEQLPRGWVASTTLWLVDDDDYIGSVNIRHDLTDWLLRFGGHIGYAIRPSRRRQGYGRTICRLALIEARNIGLDRVLITCDADNVGSRKIIEANGGVLENEVFQPENDAPKRRYWIDVRDGEDEA